MSNPPLSILSDDLLDYIVEHVAKLPRGKRDLYRLSLTDRVFTRSCQLHMFKDLHFGNCSGKKIDIREKLVKIRKLLDCNPSYADHVRNLCLTISQNHNAWLFHDPTFISIIQLLAKSPVPPHKLSLHGYSRSNRLTLEDPTLFVARLAQSFFSRTLTTLHLVECNYVPLTLFLACPKLREVLLDRVHMTRGSYHTYCEEQYYCGEEPPALEHLHYCDSRILLKRMLVPPPQLSTGVVRWSNIRTLKLEPHNIDEMAYLQLVLDAGCNTLEELYLTNLPKDWRRDDDRFLPVPMMNLNKLFQLRTFSLDETVGDDSVMALKFSVIDTIKAILGTIPASNQVTTLFFEFTIAGLYPFHQLFKEDWGGLCNEVVRISAEKPLEFHIEGVAPPSFNSPATGLKRLYKHLSILLANHPNIFTRFCKVPDVQ